MCSGPSQAEKDAQKAQAAFSQQMQTIFTQAYADDTQLANFLKAQLEPMVTNPQGFSATQLADLQSSLLGTVGAQEQNAQRQAQQQFATHNLAGLPSGVQAQVQAQLAGQGAQALAGGENQIQLASAELAQQRQMAALGMLSGPVAGLQNAVPQSGGLFNTSNQAAWNQAHAMNQEGFGWSQLLGGVMGAGMGFLTGGLGNLTSGLSFLGGPAGGGSSGGGAAPLVGGGFSQVG